MKISDVLEKGWNNRNSNRKTSNNSFSYNAEEDKFYSYNTEIAYIDRFMETLFIYGLTAGYNNFYSTTTSSHFRKLINFCIDKKISFQIIPQENIL
tara:strand:- start:6900 stop:7187 length:288 start_codon:yes stop_codon:yes gene_type:complete